MSLIIIFLFALLALYVLIFLFYRRWFRKLQRFQPDKNFTPKTTFSVIIPARNEAATIGNCLSSVLKQNYPSDLFEVIVIDDYSTDTTAAVVLDFQTRHANVHLVQIAKLLSKNDVLNSYKKKAIEIAIAKASKSWIISTDADCIVPEKWLCLFDSYIQQNDPLFVAAPVVFTNNRSALQSFQFVDFMALQGITAASVFAGIHAMSNGANLAYAKKVFYEVGGFKNIDTIASGDDMFLMHKIATKYPAQIGYIFSQDATVTTAPMYTWNSFLQQRIRWASKSDKYPDKSLLFVLAVVYLLNVSLLVLPFATIFSIRFLWVWIILLFGKTLVELYFLQPVAKFYRSSLKASYLLLEFIHIPYIVLSGWLGKFGYYHWKGRRVK